jgi:hypothetical protein
MHKGHYQTYLYRVLARKRLSTDRIAVCTYCFYCHREKSEGQKQTLRASRFAEGRNSKPPLRRVFEFRTQVVVTRPGPVSHKNANFSGFPDGKGVGGYLPITCADLEPRPYVGSVPGNLRWLAAARLPPHSSDTPPLAGSSGPGAAGSGLGRRPTAARREAALTRSQQGPQSRAWGAWRSRLLAIGGFAWGRAKRRPPAAAERPRRA